MKYCLLKFIILLSLGIDYNRWYCFCDKKHFASSQDGTKSEVSSRIKISKIDPEHHSSVAKQTRISRVSHKPQLSLSTPLLINNELKRPSSLQLSGKPGIIFRTSKVFQEAVIQTITNEESKNITANIEPVSTASQAEAVSISDGEEAVLKPSVQVEEKSSKNYQGTSQQNEASISVSIETQKEAKQDPQLEKRKVEKKESSVKSTEDAQNAQDNLESSSSVIDKGTDQPLDEKVTKILPGDTDSSARLQEKAVQTEAGTKTDTTQSTHSEVMPSFDEWKKMMLAEQEKGGHKIQPPSSVSGKKVTGHKRIHNYASYECGAKVVASNSEAEGTNHILNEMFDQYMLNPCKAKIWFVIELCESIQASQIELANFELFSSSPKEFAISWSDRFPTREWTPLGVIVVEDQRALQSFNLQHQGYGKFIKLELLSHYGTEHYCPLSVVRVFGTSMVDEYEEMETDVHHVPEEDDDDRLDIPSTEETGSSQDLFGSARDAVMNIVKKAAQVLSRDNQQDSTEGPGLADLLDTQSSFQAECERYFNCTDSTNLTVKDKITLPITSPFIPHLQYCDSCSLKIDNYQTHTGSVSACQFLFAALGPLVWEKLCEQYKILYEGISSSAKVIISDTPATDSTSLPPHSETKSPISTSDKSEKLDASFSKLSSSSSKSSDSPIQSEEPHSSTSSSSISESSHDLQKSIQPTKTLPHITDKVESKIGEKDSETFSEILQDTITKEKPKSGKPSVTIADRERVSTSEVIDSTTEMEKTKKVSIYESTTESTETSVIQESRTLVPEVEESTVSVTQSVQPSSSVLTPPAQQEADITKDEIERFEKEEKYDNGEQSSILTKVEPLSVGTPSTPPGQKESVFMRMGNRIKALELNMSLSSQYLQELSQRYRRQMEEMQKAFNRTIGTLNDTARKAAVRDLHQREAIDHLQAQVANLTQAVDLLLHERQSAHRHMLETHLCLMFIEAIVMITILSLCVRRMGSISLQQKPVVATDSSQPQSFQTYTEYNARESSSTSLGRKRSSTDVQFSVPHVNYQVAEQLTPIIAEPPPKVKKKHHRNKKKSQHVKFDDQTSDLCSKNCFSSLLDCDINSGQSSEKTSLVQTIKTVNCENSHFVQKLTDRDRTKAVPLQNLTNGPVHVNSNGTVQADKFNVKKFLKMQKKHSI